MKTKIHILFLSVSLLLIAGTSMAAPPLDVGERYELSIAEMPVLYAVDFTTLEDFNGPDYQLIAIMPATLSAVDTEQPPADHYHWRYYHNKPLGKQPLEIARSKLSCAC